MTPFFFNRTPRVIFGPGTIASIGTTASAYGPNALLVTGGLSFRISAHYMSCANALREAGITIHEITVNHEPSPEIIDAAVVKHAVNHISVVIAIGGGSVIDTGKAIAAMLPLGKPILPYLEGVGTLKHPGTTLPLIAVPTTAGTGSEASANAVISSIGLQGFKRSLRHENFIPAIAIIDPALAVSCPAPLTAACGMDAITQLLESYVSTGANPMTDALVLDALRRAAPALPAVVRDGSDIGARSAMSYAAVISGVALANAGLGAVHGLAAIIGGLVQIPHGVVCGALLGPVTRVTIEKLAKTDSNHPALSRYADAVTAMNGMAYPDVTKACEALVSLIDRWTQELGIPELAGYGVDAEEIIDQWTEKDSKNNPIALDAEDIRNILQSEA